MTDRTELRRQVRAFLTDERARGTVFDRPDSWVSGWDRGFSERLAGHGWIGLALPQTWGGAGLGPLERYVVIEELLAAGAPVSAHWISDRQAGLSLLSHGTEEQKAHYLPAIVAGRCFFSIGMSERQSGSDLASVQTRAVRDRDGWRLTGTKMWTGGAHVNDVAIVLARTSDSDDPHAGLSQFLVDLRDPGVRVEPIRFLTGGHRFNETHLDAVRAELLGAEGEGWQQVTGELADERSGPERLLSTVPLVTSLVATLTAPSAEQQRALGRQLARLSALRGLSLGVARERAAGRSPEVRAALVKDLGTRFEGELVDAIRALVPDRPADPSATPGSFTELLAFAQLHRPAYTLRGGTNEILRGIITRGASSLIGTADDFGLAALPAFDPLAGDARNAWPSVRDDAPTDVPGAVALAAAAGEHSAAGPVAHSALVAPPLLARLQLEPAPGGTVVVAADDLDVRWAHPRSGIGALGTTGDGTDVVLDGVLRGVPWFGLAESLLLLTRGPSGPVALQLAADRLTTVARTDLAGRPLFDVHLLGLVVADAVAVDEPFLADARRLLSLADAATALGAARRARDLTIAHTQRRRQFGRPLAAFQAVKQELARLIEEVALVEAAVDAAATHPDRDLAVAAAAAVTAAATGEITRIAHQLHGAVGFTERSDLRLATAQLWALRDSPRLAAASGEQALGGAAFAAGPQGWWPQLRALSDQ